MSEHGMTVRQPGRRCPNGHEVRPTAQFCPRCGASLSASRGERPSQLVWAIGSIGAVVLVAVLGGVVWFVAGERSGPGPVTTSPSSTTPQTTASTVPATVAPAPLPPPAPATVDPGAAVLTEPAGLFCRDLLAKGYPYADAVRYWDREGRPDRLDADRNGIPCETVYPASDVRRVWP